MAMLDLNLQFCSNLAILGANVNSFVWDSLTGQMLTGTTFTPMPPNTIDGNTTYFGMDFGIGSSPGTPRIIGEVNTAFVAGTSLQVAFQGAPDNATAHANGLLASLVFVTHIETDPIPIAQLTLNTPLFSFSWPMRQFTTPVPRFFRLLFKPTGTFTAGTVSADVALQDVFSASTLPQFSSNFVAPH